MILTFYDNSGISDFGFLKQGTENHIFDILSFTKDDKIEINAKIENSNEIYTLIFINNPGFPLTFTENISYCEENLYDQQFCSISVLVFFI